MSLFTVLFELFDLSLEILELYPLNDSILLIISIRIIIVKYVQTKKKIKKKIIKIKIKNQKLKVVLMNLP